MATYAEKLAAFAREVRFEDLPEEVIASAKLHIIDTLGVCLASAAEPFGRAITDLVIQWGGKDESTVIGCGRRLPAPSAALANGVLGHGLDFDDTHSASVTHPSASLVPAALAVSEATDANGRDLLVAAVVGWETVTRIGLVAPGVFQGSGLHATPIAGCFGAALTAGKLLDLPQRELVAALGICGSQAAGLLEFMADGSSVKRLHAGWAAHSGIVAAQLAQHGFAGPGTVFEGRFGLFRSLLGLEAGALGPLDAGLGSVWQTTRLALKPYPCSHLSHAFVDASLTLRRETALDPDEIVAIECVISKQAVPMICEPLEAKRRPRSSYDALFSLPYVVAIALRCEALSLDHFGSPFLERPDVLALAQKVSYSIDPASTYPVHFPGEVKVTLADGRVVGKRVDVDRGGPDNPLSVDEIEEKFLANAANTLPPSHAHSLLDVCSHLEEVEKVSTLTRLFSVDRL